MSNQDQIRNFSIIAHIDHGKSTLSDRIIQFCGGLEQREMKAQVLDSLDIERERGITIKAQCVSLTYKSKIDGKTYYLNFIDTPGHVDFSYEVSRSLMACEVALLIVDASQGVEAQTIANCYAAMDAGLEVLPVLNKIDLPAADCERVRAEIEDTIGIDAAEALGVSAKTGEGVEALLEQLVQFTPAPTGDRDAPAKALIIDSWFDNYLGVISLIRVFSGSLSKGERVRVMSIGSNHEITQIGQFTPKRVPRESLSAGEVGYLVAAVKNIHGVPVGDTLTGHDLPCDAPLEGFRSIQPRVFAGLYPVSTEDYEDFREGLEKLCLNDSALQYEPETSDALGFGFRIGFLGMLHMEIVRERLEREYDLSLITTSPTVLYRVETRDGEIIEVENPSKMPSPGEYVNVYEPMIKANIYAPEEYIGNIITLCIEKRGIQENLSYVGKQAHLTWNLPLNEVVVDFFERLKSCSRGYASMDYEMAGYSASDLIKMDVLINGENVDALACLMHRDRSQSRGRALIENLRDRIPRQMFEIALQAAIGAKIIARTNIRALRKNVTAKCYGGDVSRKKKLLEKQKKGKKRMKSIGRVEVPQDAFLAILDNRGD